MPSALYTKSKVCKTALSADCNFIWHAQLTGSWGLQLKWKPPKPKQKNKSKTAMRFWRRVKACSLTLESAAWQWTSSPALITIVKRTRHKLLKNIRTSVLKTHSQITHTYLGCLPHLLLCDSLIWYWNIEQIFGHFFFLFIMTLSIPFYLCLHPFLLSSFSF